MGRGPFREQPWLMFSTVGFPLLIGIISVIGNSVISQCHRARVESSREAIEVLASALDVYGNDCGHLPSAEQGLKALVSQPQNQMNCKNWKGPYTKSSLRDAWGRPFVYTPTDRGFVITSLGSDGREGGTGYDLDLQIEHKGE